MLNSPENTIFSRVDENRELLPPGSPWRIWGTGAVFGLCCILILARTAWIQMQLPDVYLESLQATTIEEEVLPARDGRILAGSEVLAADEDVYVVQVHFRWIQNTADENWMRLQVRQRLSRDERRQPPLVERVRTEIQTQRDDLWQALSEVTGSPISELTARRSRIEKTVGRIIESVNARHRRSVESSASSETEDIEEQQLPVRWLTDLRNTLTTPPERKDADRIYVREEETWHTVINEVSAATAAIIIEHPERFPGTRIQTVTRRVYPMSETAEHLTGARLKPSQEVAAVGDDSAGVRRIGQFGVEKQYDAILSGRAGVRRIVRDRRQRIVSSEVVRAPESGRDVSLTIDLPLQSLAEQLLAESLGDADPVLLESAKAGHMDASGALPEPQPIPVGGSVIVMDSESGEVLTAASAPGFDLSMFVIGTESQWKAVNTDGRHPFVPRFMGMALPPGSTFKVVSALAALQSGVIDPQTQYECRGYLSDPDEHRCLIFRLYGQGHGPVNLRRALAESCNTYFFDAARRMGVVPLVASAELLEAGKVTGVDLPYEKPGRLPKPASSGGATGSASRSYERETLGIAIGQSRLTMTPLQMARVMAFIANNGWLVTPHVLSDEGRALQDGGADDHPVFSRTFVSSVSSANLQAIREGLVAAVEEPTGTGFRTARVSGVRVAGKTGTAESTGKPDHAWFVGYFPADQPRYVIVVTLEHGGSGARAAAPIAAEMIRSMNDRGLLQDASLTQR